MAAVWGTIQDHHGYSNVDSKPGRGTTFHLYFPVTRKQPAGGVVSLPIREYTGAGQTILVIDDVKEQGEIPANMLTKLIIRSPSSRAEKKRWPTWKTPPRICCSWT